MSGWQLALLPGLTTGITTWTQ